MKILVLGVQGMAGHVVSTYLQSNEEFEVVGLARRPGFMTSYVSDLCDISELGNILSEVAPDIVINCVGMLVKESNENVRKAIQVNSLLPHFLSCVAREMDFKLIHISTDCVFSGNLGGYVENSFRDGDDAYARTKALGELVNEFDLTIRTSIIGPELKGGGVGLFHWFMSQTDEVFGYDKALWSGVTTLELAKAIEEMIKQNVVGLYHLTPTNQISKYQLLKLLAESWNLDIKVQKDIEYICDKTMHCTRDDFDYLVSDYAIMIKDLHDWVSVNNEFYQHGKYVQ